MRLHKIFFIILPVFLIFFLFTFFNQIRAQEGHYLRPYPGEPLKTATEPLASYCGSDITISQKVTATYTPDNPNCTKTGENRISCAFKGTANTPLTISLGEASLPIMGNTEGELSSSEKINEYVSWYLSGVPFKKETYDENDVVNYSGPVNKLLPQEIAYAKRIETTERALGKDVNDDGLKPENDRHNQTVVCTNIKGEPVDCEGLHFDEKDFNYWDKTIFPATEILNKGIDLFGNMVDYLLPSQIADYIEAIKVWNLRTPPLSWDFSENIYYKKAYNEWIGKSCLLIPAPIKTLICIKNPLLTFVSNDSSYVKLFPFVPLSSTEDLSGQVKIDSPSFSNQTPANLFFAHMEEASEMASILQDTYIAKEEEKTGSPSQVETPKSCKEVDVRSNKGDSLLAGEISGDLSYNMDFSCDFFYTTDINGSITVNDDSCSKTVNITLSSMSYTPLVDDLWSRLVAGPTSIFKRIFPKLGTQIGTIKDIAGATTVDVSGTGVSSQGQLKFPHIGGISEYFLKGIQTALRPKGFGEMISFGETTDATASGSVDCNQSAPEISLPNTISKEELHEVAIRWQGREGDKVLECYNDVAGKSLAAGVSPAFTFFYWINESGGSNYEISNQDWGINSSSVVGFNAQLERFLGLAKGYKATYPQCFGKARSDTEVFFDLFTYGLQGGKCPEPDTHYQDIFNAFWNIFTSCPLPEYPFSASCY